MKERWVVIDGKVEVHSRQQTALLTCLIAHRSLRSLVSARKTVIISFSRVQI
jgi:hypothetical protein